MVTVGPGTRVVMPEPTFSLYALLTRDPGRRDAGGVPWTPSFEYDAARARRDGARAGADAHDRLLAQQPDGQRAGAWTTWPRCARPTWAWWWWTRRTTSSPAAAWCRSSAGTRTSWSCARSRRPWPWPGCASATCWPHPALVREVNKARLPYNLNFFSQAAALAALADPAALRGGVARIVAARQELFRRLAHVAGVRPFPSQANFILFELESADPRAVFESMLRPRGAGARRERLSAARPLPARERGQRRGERRVPDRAAPRGVGAALQEGAVMARAKGGSRRRRGTQRFASEASGGLPESGKKATSRHATSVPLARRSAERALSGRLRRAVVERKTSETDVRVRLDLDGQGRSEIATGIGFLDHMLTAFAKHGRFDLEVRCAGRPARRRAPHRRGRGHRARPGPHAGPGRQGRHRALRPCLRAARRGARRAASSTSPAAPTCTTAWPSRRGSWAPCPRSCSRTSSGRWPTTAASTCTSTRCAGATRTTSRRRCSRPPAARSPWRWRSIRACRACPAPRESL